MNSIRRLSIVVAALVFCVSFARGQEVRDPSARAEQIANWPAPVYWIPPGRAIRSLGERSWVGVEAVEGALLSASPMPFIGVTPCRLLDTRPPANNPLDGDGIFGVDEIRTYTLPGACGLPETMQAVSLNVTATNTGSGAFGHIKIWPADQVEPNVSTLNYPGAGATIANAAVAPLSVAGALSVKSGNASADVILDVNGYYAPAGVGTENTFLGLNAGNFTMTGNFNTGLGQNALFFNTTGGGNTATGAFTLAGNTTATANTATGYGALFSNTSGFTNTATGYSALFSNTTGTDNTATGAFALQNTMGSSNIGIGRDGGSNLTTGSNNICIGNPGVAGESNTIRIGTVGTQTATFIAGIYDADATGGTAVFVTPSGKLGTGMVLSSHRFKRDIRDIAEESDGLMRLRPVAFKYKPDVDATGLAQYGLIAEEVAKVYPDLVVYDRDGRPDTVRYHLVNALLLNEVQKQHRITEAQQKTNEEQEKTIEQLKAQLSRLEAQLDLRH